MYNCCLQNQSKFVNNFSRITQKLENLPSFTECTVTVQCKPFYRNKSYGFWSESRTKAFRSQEGGFS